MELPSRVILKFERSKPNTEEIPFQSNRLLNQVEATGESDNFSFFAELFAMKSQDFTCEIWKTRVDSTILCST